MRAAQEERRTLTRTSTRHSLNKSVITDANLDEDGDLPFPEDKPGSLIIKYSYILFIFFTIFS